MSKGRAPYYRPKKDINHKELVDGCRKCGLGVVDLAGLGKGVPDLLISNSTIMRLVEIKCDAKAKLTPDQVRWWECWTGVPVHIAWELEQILELMKEGR